jgi:hypothetical protein
MKWPGFVVAIAIVTLTSLAAAQLSAERRAAFEAASKLETSVSGVHAFTTPPKGFDPLTATNQELWQYGLPEPPDQTADPKGYAGWQRAMLALRFHATDVHMSNFSHRPAEITSKSEAVSNGPSTSTSPNWSGMVSTNTNKVWNDKTSFDKVESVWNVPAAQPPFNAPNSDGPIWSVSNWNGIDGFGTDTLVQGGTNSIYQSAVGSTYVGWVEWWPSYAEIVIDCSKSTACPVYPGDDFYTITYGAAGTVEQYVYDEDLTTGWYGTFGMTFKSGVGVLGASAEYITERPCCVTVSGKSHYYPLANYIYDFFDYSFAYDGAGTLFYPGSTSASTYLVTMTADNGTTDISYPTAGTSGYQGRYSVWFADENCAYTKGCAY